jgi:2-oxoacid dehydrogenases acyltransferase (catalytic domain)
VVVAVVVSLFRLQLPPRRRRTQKFWKVCFCPGHVCGDGQIGRGPAAHRYRSVTAVGMFGGGGGFGLTPLALMSLDVVVGGMSPRPCVIDGQVTARDVLHLTVGIDHNVVDGAPAARFAAEFRELLETAAMIAPPGGPRLTAP